MQGGFELILAPTHLDRPTYRSWPALVSGAVSWIRKADVVAVGNSSLMCYNL